MKYAWWSVTTPSTRITRTYSPYDSTYHKDLAHIPSLLKIYHHYIESETITHMKHTPAIEFSLNRVFNEF